MEYTVIRSKRKTISLSVDNQLNVVVRAPLHASQQRIRSFVAQNEEWIYKRKALIGQYNIAHPCVSGEYGQRIFYLGREYTIAPTESKYVYLGDASLFVPTRKPVKQQLTEWYKKQARAVLTERTEYYAALWKLDYKHVRISSARTRYGSCSPDNGISYTFRMVMLPIDLIDYVVVHELCHTCYKDHQKSFWNAVQNILPDYKDRRKRINKEYNIMDCL